MFNLTDPNKKLWIERCLKNEMFVSKYLKHPNIIFTYDAFKTRRNAYIVMQLAPGGDLRTDCYDRLKRGYLETEAKKHFGALMSGLLYMHQHNVCHRDLKLENVCTPDYK